MARKPNEVRLDNELPKWFDIRKYDASKDLDANGWHQHLSIRRTLLRIVGSDGWKIAHQDGLNERYLRFVSDLEALRKTPVFDSSFREKLGWPLCTSLKKISPESGIRQLNVADFYWAEKAILEKKRDYARKVFSMADDSESLCDAINRVPEDDAWGQNPLLDVLSAGGNRAFIEVNFQLPEKMLLDQFKTLVQRAQRTMNESPKIRYEHWVEYGVLPYLDLKIWEQETGKHIVNSVKTRAIFKKGGGDEEVIRKTTSKLASEAQLLGDENLKELAAIAAHGNSGSRYSLQFSGKK